MASLFRDNTAPSRFADYRQPKRKPGVSREKLAADIAAFTENGGKITKVKTGVSGLDRPLTYRDYNNKSRL